MSDTDTITAALAGLRCRERELELEAVAVRSRVAEVRDMIERLEPRRRPGRPRAAAAVNTYPSQIMEQSASARATPLQMPQRVDGGMAVAEADLPSLDDVRGILRTPEPPEAA